MGSFSDTPALMLDADANILPFSFISIGTSSTALTTADNTGKQTSGNATTILGVTDGSTKAFDNTYHATKAGDTLTLQGGDVVLIRCTSASGSIGTISAGTLLESHSDGCAKAATTTASSASPPNTYFQGYMALEAGAVSRVIRALKVGGWKSY